MLGGTLPATYCFWVTEEGYDNGVRVAGVDATGRDDDNGTGIDVATGR